MGGQLFCAMLQSLQAAAPAFKASELPTLHAFSALAAEFLQAAAPEGPGGHSLVIPYKFVGDLKISIFKSCRPA